MDTSRTRYWPLWLSLISLGSCTYPELGDPASPAKTTQALAVCENNIPVRPLASLAGVRPTEPANLAEFVRDRRAAVALGKALFWDMNVGSDGVMSCATCHFRAGADPRSKNQLSPKGPGPGEAGTPPFQVGGPNYALSTTDFPLRRLQDPNNRNSPVLQESNDVVSSQGVVRRTFLDIVPGNPVDRGILVADPVFSLHGVNTRTVEPRNTPSVINAALSPRSFWDGRARGEFNGVNPFGDFDPSARILLVRSGRPAFTKIRIPNAALASQAVGPPLSELEMSHLGRTFPKVGKKLLSLVPLSQQEVHPADSVLGPLSRSPNKGLTKDYATLIRNAFVPPLWNSPWAVKFGLTGPILLSPNQAAPPPHRGTDEFSVMEYNFSLFFGLAIQLYEATLIADDTPLDRFLAGDASALSAQQLRGLAIFTNQTPTPDLPAGRCITCHDGAELSQASATPRPLVNRTVSPSFLAALRDTGFSAVGVRPPSDDLGVGGLTPLGTPLSDARLVERGLLMDPRLTPVFGTCLPADTNIRVNATFKIPSLRNVELSAPYFHNGGQATLHQVVDFYGRGGDFAPGLPAIPMGDSDREALVAFLRSLTDERVRFAKAPFDHPELTVPLGHEEAPLGLVQIPEPGGVRAKDRLMHIAPVGEQGGPTLPGFLD